MIAYKLAAREIKNNKKYWAFFTANLCIGLMGFTFIYMFRVNITETLEQRAKTILSSDVAVSGRRALSNEERKEVQKYLKDKITKTTQTRELYTMAKTQKKSEQGMSRLVFVKSIKGEYPLIGEIKIDNGEVFNEKFISELQKFPWIIISKEIEHQFKVKKGDDLWLGDQKFTVYGILESDSTSSLRGVSLAPKVYIGDGYLDKTNLISFGTLAFYSDFFLLKPNIDLEKLKNDLYSRISDPAIRVNTPKNSSEQLGRVINYLSDYLGLIGIVALLISCVGASYLFQSYVYDRLNQLGILKSIGVSKRGLMGSFVLIVVFFGLLATFISLGLGQTLLPLALSYLKNWMNFEITPSLDLEMAIIVISIGVVTNLLICLPILEKVFKSKTIDLLNSQISQKFSKSDLIYYIPAVLFLWLLSVWQANSFRVGSIFVFALFVVFFIVLLILPLALNYFSKVLIKKPINWPFSLGFGYSFRVVSRNKFSSLLTILCLAIGVSLLSVIGQLDKSLKQELIGDQTPKPSLFLFDIQEEQYAPLVKLAAEKNIPLNDPSPMIRARLVKKNGEKIKRQLKQEGFTTNEEERRRRFNNRGVNLSYSKDLNTAETIVEGKPFSGIYSGEGIAEISLEKRYARRMQVGIGDTLTYNILGVDIKGKIVNLRTVKWTSFLPNFFITIQPGVLNDAPKSYLTAVRKVPLKEQLRIQDLIVENFPNISMINVTEVITKMTTLFTAMAFAIGIMSLCCISVGVFVLYSILQSQMFKKQKDFALQKIIGMNEKEIFKTLFLEYFILVFLALSLGSLIGFGLALMVSKLFLDGIFIINSEFFIIFNSLILFISSFVIYISYKTNFKKSVKELLY